MPPSASLPLTLLLGALLAVAPIGTDMVVPTLPAIAQDFGAPIAGAQLTLSAFFLGFAGGQLVWGPLSDRVGRRPALAGGMALALAASMGAALAGSIEALAWARLAQGLGLSAGPVLARSIVRDLHSHEQAARLMARMMIVFSVAPIASPLAGAALLALGWRAVPVAHALVSAALLVAIALVLKETAPDRRASASPRAIAPGFAQMLAEPRFRSPWLTLLAVFCGIFAFVANSSFALTQAFGVSPAKYALLFAIVMIGQAVGAQAANRLALRIGIAGLLRGGTQLACAAGVAAFAMALAGVAHWAALVVPMAVYMCAATLVIPAGTAAALTPFPQAAGAASSLLGASQFALGAAVSAVLGAAFDGSTLPMTFAIALGGTLAVVCETLLVRRLPRTAG